MANKSKKPSEQENVTQGLVDAMEKRGSEQEASPSRSRTEQEPTLEPIKAFSRVKKLARELSRERLAKEAKK